MYNKTSFINETDYAEVSGTRWIMRDLPNYAEGHRLCAKLCAHNRIIQRSLAKTEQPGNKQIYKIQQLSGKLTSNRSEDQKFENSIKTGH